MARVRRGALSAIAAAVAVALGAPGVAQARTPCPGETTTPTAATSAQVSDAILCLTNQIRASYGLPALRRDARLDTAARLHSEDMAARGFFAHTTPEGLEPGDRAAAQGYSAGVGENVAVGHPTARAVVLDWMGSAGHCRNVLGTARDIGVGTAPSPRAHYTQVFGSYAFTSESAASAGCPHAVDLDALPIPDLVGIVTGAPAEVASGPAAGERAARARPALGRLALSPARLRPGRRSVLSYTLTSRATVTARIERAPAGRRLRWRLLPGRLTDAGVQGSNRLRFGGRLRGRRLVPGRYRLRAVAADGAGRRSASRRVTFWIVRR